MKILARSFSFSLLLLVASVLLRTQHSLPFARPSETNTDDAVRRRVLASYGRLPLHFEPNQGQTDPAVKFLSRGSGYSLFLSATSMTLALPAAAPSDSGGRRNPSHAPAAAPRDPSPATLLRMQLVNANASPQVQGLEKLPGTSNYFLGSDPAAWRTDVAHFSRVLYQDVYPGIALAYYGDHRQLEYDFVVAPGAAPGAIQLEIQGAEKLELNAEGDLLLAAPAGELRMHRPVVYQEAGGTRREIPAAYVLRDGNRIGFEIASYDRAQPLIIDPVLVYSTFLGGAGGDGGFSVAVDASGNAFVAGTTGSNAFPVSNPLQPARAGNLDIFVTKMNAAGNALVYSTYLGGAGSDVAFGIALDASGNAYITGRTSSTNFPVLNPFQSAFGGGNQDAFVAKLNASGNALAYSTYLGGSGSETGSGIVVDPSGSAYVVGDTDSSNFPTANALQAARRGIGDAFVTKLSAAGSALVYSTYLGGSDDEFGFGITRDSSLNVYLTGLTTSPDFPTATPFQSSFAGGLRDAFVSKLNASGSALVYSTYVGGNAAELGASIAVDAAGNAYVAGSTSSTNFPTANPFQAALRGPEDAFAAKLNASGNALVYSTYLGGASFEEALFVAVDSGGNAYLTGGTASADFPTASPLQPLLGLSDAFLTKLAPAGNTLVYSTFLGGTGDDAGWSVTLDSSESLYLAGQTDSSDFPTAGPFQAAFGGGSADAFLAKVRDLPPGTVVPSLPAGSVVNGASFRPASDPNGAVAAGAIVALFGNDLAGGTQAAASVPLPTTLLDTSVTINNVAAPLFFVSNTQINAQVPFEAPAGTLSIQVKRGSASATQSVRVSDFSPGIFTRNQQGTGDGAILHAADFAPVSASAPALPGEFISIFCTGLGRLRSPVTTGAFPPSPPPETLSLPQVTIAGIPAQVTFSGLAPCCVGLYQVNVQVPAGVPSGSQLLQITIGAAPSNTVTLPVQ